MDLIIFIAGVTAGLPLRHAHEYGALVAALSVTSPHTINKAINRDSLAAFSRSVHAPIHEAVRGLLDGCRDSQGCRDYLKRW